MMGADLDRREATEELKVTPIASTITKERP